MFCNNHEIRDDIKERMQENKEIEMTDEDKEVFDNATPCFIIPTPLTPNFKGRPPKM